MESCARELMTLPPATAIDGRYEIDRLIGIGSMSVVYAARNIADGSPCALKILSPAHAADISSATFHTRFRIGVRMAQLVVHPRVVQILDFIDQPDLMAAVMEFVDGGDLAGRLQATGAMPAEEAVRLLKQIFAGMQAIHAAGIVHRDIKPANILLDKAGNAKISDFGIARSGETPHLTAEGGVVGTIQYLSPEQLQGEDASQLSDIYALGVVAYEMVTGAVPGAHDSLYGLVDRRVSADSVPAHTLRPQCPQSLSEFISKALQRDPELRFQSVGEMLVDLESRFPEPTQTVTPVLEPQVSSITVIKESRAWQIFQGTGFQLIIAACLIAFFAGALRMPSNSTGLPPLTAANLPIPSSPDAATASSTVMSQDVRAALKGAALVGQPEAQPSPDVAALSAQQTLLYRLADFVRWPKGAHSAAGVPLRLCILGKDPFGLNLDRILSKSKTALGRGFWLQRYVVSTPLEMLRGCQILYIGSMSGAEAKALLTPLKSLPVLTVSDGTGQGIVDFVSRDGRASFVVNQALAKQSGLELSPILLDVGAIAGDGT